MPTKRKRIAVYSASYPEREGWKFCPLCRKKLFRVVSPDRIKIEIKCRCCSEIVLIEN